MPFRTGFCNVGSMAQPKFTWWPWRTLAAAVGMASCVLPVVITTLASAERSDEKELWTVGLAIFAGGNALVLGWAIGDFGRTVLALLVSIAAASAFSFLPVHYGMLAPFVIVPAITASLSLDRSFLGFAGAAYLGIKAVLRGFLIWILSYIVAVIALALILSILGLLRSAEAFAIEAVFAILWGFLTATANAFVVGYLFRAAHRVRTDLPPSPPESETDESSSSSETSGSE